MGLKPLVLFTTFWNANKIDPNKSLYNMTIKRNVNFFVYSIALSHPDKDKLKVIYPFDRLDIFCPTYEILSKYKKDNDWDFYTVEYLKILKQRKEPIINWIRSLKEDSIYVLCCWENTKAGSKCHRQLLFNALKRSKNLGHDADYIYIDG